MLPMTDARAAIEAVFQQEHGRVLAGLIAHFTGDFDLAEDALQDACVQALSAWRKDGTGSKETGGCKRWNCRSTAEETSSGRALPW